MSDLRNAMRQFVRRPAFSMLAVLTLGLGIGATAAVWTRSLACGTEQINGSPIGVEGVTPEGEVSPLRRTKVVSPGY